MLKYLIISESFVLIQVSTKLAVLLVNLLQFQQVKVAAFVLANGDILELLLAR